MGNDLITDKLAKIPNFDTLVKHHQQLIEKKNEAEAESNGVYIRYKNPVVTAAHTPIRMEV